MKIYNCDLCDSTTGDPTKTDLGLVCEDCAEELNSRAEYAYEQERERSAEEKFLDNIIENGIVPF